MNGLSLTRTNYILLIYTNVILKKYLFRDSMHSQMNRQCMIFTNDLVYDKLGILFVITIYKYIHFLQICCMMILQNISVEVRKKNVFFLQICCIMILQNISVEVRKKNMCSFYKSVV